MVRVKQQLSRNRNHGGSGNTMEYITVHQTANTSRGANAQAHANLIDNGFAATWHYTVDDTQAIQSFYESTICYHAGDGARGPGNNRSIGIELCVNSDGNYNQTVNNAVELIQDIMKRRNIPLSRVVTHGHWTGKHCPREILNGKNGINWNEFKRRLGSKASTPAPKKSAPKKSSGSKSISQMADEVIAGQHGSGHANRQQSLGVNNATYQKVRAEVNRRAGVTSAPKKSAPKKSAPKKQSKSISQMADEVEAGKHGTGHANRRRSLGVNQATYDKVRAEVNRRAGGGSSAPRGKSISQMATEVLNGQHGNGHANRQRSLGVNNATYQKVRAEVNRRS